MRVDLIRSECFTTPFVENIHDLAYCRQFGVSTFALEAAVARQIAQRAVSLGLQRGLASAPVTLGASREQRFRNSLLRLALCSARWWMPPRNSQ